MINRMWTLAPAGARGPVGLAVRPAACVAVSPAVERLRVVPASLAAQRPGTRVRGTDVFGTDVFGTGVLGAPAIDVFGTTTGYAQQASKRTTTEHNGITLGIHSSGSPSS